MIDPSLTPEEIMTRQAKIIDALVNRIERGNELGGSHFSLFQSALTLQQEVRAKSLRLEEVMRALGSTSDQLQSAYHGQEQAKRNLDDVLEMMDEGFALFSENRLVRCNAHFCSQFPDVKSKLEFGISYAQYVGWLAQSTALQLGDAQARHIWQEQYFAKQNKAFFTHILPIEDDQWIQATERRATHGNVVILHTDISHLVRKNQTERRDLIDQHVQYIQNAFNHMAHGVASFSTDFKLLVHNRMFVDLLHLPVTMTIKGTSLRRIIQYAYEKEFLAKKNYDLSEIDFNNTDPNYSYMIDIKRDNGAILEFQLQALPIGGYIASIRDKTEEETAKIAMAKINETLESHVRDRTSALFDANARLQLQFETLEKTKDDLRQAKERAEMANASKTRFLAAASHDLLQPINAAKLYISMLSEESREPQRKDHVRRLDKAFQNIESLLHDLLELSRLENRDSQIKKTDLDIYDILSNIEESVQDLVIQKNLELRFVKSHLWVVSDAHYLSRIIQNLVVNALQYTVNGKILVGCRRRGTKIHIEVWDTGIGIAPENLERIFNEFTRLSAGQSSLGGMGLGLSIVENACRHLGHKIEVKSVLGKGSMFLISLERSMSSLRKNTAPKIDRMLTTPKLNMLVILVDNDLDVLHATSTFLQNWGIDVVTASSTKEAIEHYHILEEVPDLLILDYQLDEDETGIHTLSQLREIANYEIPALMITANSDDRLADLANELNFSIHQKPIDLKKLRKYLLDHSNSKLLSLHPLV